MREAARHPVWGNNATVFELTIALWVVARVEAWLQLKVASQEAIENRVASQIFDGDSTAMRAHLRRPASVRWQHRCFQDFIFIIQHNERTASIRPIFNDVPLIPRSLNFS